MRKNLLLVFFNVFMIDCASSQITTTRVAENSEQLEYKPYDSTNNFLGKDVNKYIGQELYLKGMYEELRKYGYDGFLTDYKKTKHSKGVYKCCDGFNSKYDELNGRYYKVIDVISHPKAMEDSYLYGKKFYLKLEDKLNKDIVYYEYDSQFKHSFPFIVVGFYEKIRRNLIGNEFIFSNRILNISTGKGLELKTGKPLTINVGETWKCVDLTIEEKYYELALVIINSIGEKTTVAYDIFSSSSKHIYTIYEANEYKEKFGFEKFYKILEGKAQIGMTKEMCLLSWGKPNSINETITANSKNEQWVYQDGYLYFEDGILTAIQ